MDELHQMNLSANGLGLPPAPFKNSHVCSVAAAVALGFLLAGVPLLSSRAAIPNHGVAAGLLNVEQVFGLEDNTNAEVTLALGLNNFQVPSFNRADYTVAIGVGLASSNDENRGVLMTSVAENGRNNFGTNGYPTSSMATNGSGTYRIVGWLGTGGAGSAVEYNVNVAGAWFPYDRYLGGFARNSGGTNGGVNDTFTASPGLLLGTHFKNLGSGLSVVDLRSRGIDSRTDGVLLVSHAKDENNFALSQVNATDGTWNVFVRDNAQPTYGTYEQDPVAFVFIPKTNTALISGRFLATGSISMFSGSSPQFTVTNLGEGRWDFRVIGHSPTNGVLIISPEGGGSYNGDNIVSYQPYTDGLGWEIQSRDTPVNGLQTPTGDPVVSFVYIPEPSPGCTVAPTNGLVTSSGRDPATFTVVLEAQPKANVTITLTSSDPGKGLPSPASLTFATTDWQVPQTVTVTSQAGAPDGPYTILLAPASSTDPAYQGLNPDDVFLLSAAARASLVSPTNSAHPGSTSPTLRVQVTNSTPGNLTVTFYGREASTSFPGPDFSIAVLPDTQFYSAEKYGGTKEMFFSQIEWVITNRVSRNIVYVTQLGDIVNDGDIYLGAPNLTQWRNATNAMYRQESPVRTQLPEGIPYGVAVGNHEMEPIGDPTGTTIFYNQYFGVNHFNGRSYYAGHYGTNNNNHFDLFSASGLDFIVLYFEYDPDGNPATLAWGNNLLQTYANRRAIVITHGFGNTATPLAFSTQGALLYNGLKANTNLFLQLGGHVTGQGARQDTYAGNVVHTFVQDYQGWTNGGNGFMRLYEFSPSNNVVVVQTFSPWTGEYLTDDASEFFFSYGLQSAATGPPGAFIALGTNTGVPPGSLSSCTWPGLQANKAYDWYVTVTDAAGGSVPSPVWSFTTAAGNALPVAANLLRTIAGDAPSNLVLLATDANGDALTFQTHSSPTHGLLRDFNPATGSLTYYPTYGYRGSDRFTFSASDGLGSSSVATMNLNINAPSDTNANGLPDTWETAYGISNPEADADGDGRSNLEEYQANTSPTNAASVFRILSADRQTNGYFGLTWSAVGGTRYRVQFSNGNTNAGLTGVFTDIVRNLTNEMDASAYGSPSTQSFTETLSLTGPHTNGARYYRIKLTP